MKTTRIFEHNNKEYEFIEDLIWDKVGDNFKIEQEFPSTLTVYSDSYEVLEYYKVIIKITDVDDEGDPLAIIIKP